MKFVVDSMLGSLARWLRMLGYETKYDSKADDNSLLEKTIQAKAILLTRDKELYGRAIAKHLEVVLVLGESDDARLGLLAKSLGFSITLNMSIARCPECDSDLSEISPNEASAAVPETSLKRYDKFWRCNNGECGKTYWQGSHMKNINRTLEEAQRIASKA